MSNSLTVDRSVPEWLLAQGPACQWALDRQGIFVQMFGNACELFQMRADQVIGRALAEVLPATDVPPWTEHVRRAFAGEKSLVTEVLERAQAVFAVTLFPLHDESGEVRLAGGLAVDVTRSQLAERHMRTTALQVLNTQEAEHARISRFLHDEVGQSLTAAGMQLDILRMDLEESVPGISERTAEIQAMLEVVVDRIRDLSYELNPSIVERAGFHSALDRLAGRCRRSFSGTLRLMADSSLRIPSDIGSALYKIAQGAIENAIQHASCSQIELLMKATQAGPILEVRDNGRGFPAGSSRKLGLMLMEHYARQAGLKLSIESQPGRGTTVRASWERNLATRT